MDVSLLYKLKYKGSKQGCAWNIYNWLS